jgi:hypothetical protein
MEARNKAPNGVGLRFLPMARGRVSTTIGPMRRHRRRLTFTRQLEPEVTTVRRYRLLTLLMTAAMVAACSAQSPSGAAQTSGAGDGQATPTTGSDATQGSDATATPAGGGGGGGGGSANSVHFEVTSSLLNQTGDLPFVALASVFGGEANTSLSFATASTNDVMGILILQGNVAVSYSASTSGVTVAAPICTVTDLHLDATSASGSFDCTNADVLTTSGGVGKGEIKGTFSGSK